MTRLLPLAVLLCLLPALAPLALAQEAAPPEVTLMSTFVLRGADVQAPSPSSISGTDLRALNVARENGYSGWLVTQRADGLASGDAGTRAFHARWDVAKQATNESLRGAVVFVAPILVLRPYDEPPALYDPDWSSRRWAGGVVYAEASEDHGTVTLRYPRGEDVNVSGFAQATLIAAVAEETRARAERDAIRTELRALRRDVGWDVREDEAQAMLETLGLLEGRVRALADEAPPEEALAERNLLPRAWADALAQRRSDAQARHAQWAQELAEELRDAEADIHAARARAEASREFSLASLGLVLTGVGLLASVVAGLPETVRSWRGFRKRARAPARRGRAGAEPAAQDEPKPAAAE